jgi:hypothetical protein
MHLLSRAFNVLRVQLNAEIGEKHRRLPASSDLTRHRARFARLYTVDKFEALHHKSHTQPCYNCAYVFRSKANCSSIDDAGVATRGFMLQ